VLLTTVGLSALGSLLMAALEIGGRDIDLLMCSTAYGGSSQQADILSKRSRRSKAVRLQKHTFDIQGKLNVLESISAKLEAMKAGPKKDITLVELEYPTNPDMKDCDVGGLESIIQAYSTATGSRTVLILDTTFAPPSKSAAVFGDRVPVVVFTSLSKSVSGGFTTGGSLVANGHPLAQEMLKRAHTHLALVDTSSKPCQLKVLAEMHAKCEERVRLAHKNTIAIARHFENTVQKFSGQTMKVNFVTESQMAKGVTPATFSLNLPAPVHMKDDRAALAALAQQFVDAVVKANPEGVKPCVSFGQQNTLVYATVPATSTQGVISAEDTEKQAVGGVQLVRFSFPPSMDMAKWEAAVEAALEDIYTLPSPSFMRYYIGAAVVVAAASIGYMVYKKRR